jgi:hypothetical protein
MWLESRQGFNFGRESDLLTALIRHRLGVDIRPAPWLKVSAMVQDTRAPHYQRPRPGSAQDPFDLHEAYMEAGALSGTGWSVLAGRKRFAFRDWIVVGLPEWSNSGRTYDTAQLRYSWASSTLNLLAASNVRFDPTGFNRLNAGDRLVGAYWESKSGLDLFAFHNRRQTQPDTVAGGGRFERAWNPQWKTSAEVIAQNRAFGSVVTVTRRLARTELIGDFEYFSANYDRLLAALHDRFGHTDLFDTRNIQGGQGKWRVPTGKKSRLTALYSVNSRVDASRPAYANSNGLPVGVPGSHGKFLGQEAAVIWNAQWGGFQLSFAFAQWFNGSYLNETTPGASIRYIYMHTAYSF